MLGEEKYFCIKSITDDSPYSDVSNSAYEMGGGGGEEKLEIEQLYLLLSHTAHTAAILRGVCQLLDTVLSVSSFVSTCSAHKRGGGGACINFWGPAILKGTRGTTMLHMVLSFSVVSLFVDCTN